MTGLRALLHTGGTRTMFFAFLDIDEDRQSYLILLYFSVFHVTALFSDREIIYSGSRGADFLNRLLHRFGISLRRTSENIPFY